MSFVLIVSINKCDILTNDTLNVAVQVFYKSPVMRIILMQVSLGTVVLVKRDHAL